MDGHRKNTYLPYTRGELPEDMRLGSLFLDPENPNIGLEKKRFEFKDKLSQEEYEKEIQTLAREDLSNKPPYILKFEVSTQWTFDAQIMDVIRTSGDRAENHEVCIIGKTGRRVQIRRPEQFLMKEVLTQPDVMKWISNSLSISWFARWLHYMKRGESWKAPEIWLLTGIQLIKEGKVHYGWNVASSFQVGAAVDAGVITEGVPTEQDVAKLDVKHSSTAKVQNIYGHKGERVWCAQFMKIAVEFEKEPKINPTKGSLKEVPKAERMKITLREVEDLGIKGARRFPTNEDVQSDEKLEGCAGEKAVFSWDNHTAEIVGLECVDRMEGDEAEVGENGDGELAKEIDVSEAPYAEAMAKVDWKWYEEYSTYLDYQQKELDEEEES